MDFGFVLTGVVFVLIGFDIARRPEYHGTRFAQYSLLTRGTAGKHSGSERRTRVLGVFLSCVGVAVLLGGMVI